jgi:hypothetical protein
MTHSPARSARSTTGRRASKLEGSHGNPGWAFDNTCFVNRASLSTTLASVSQRAEGKSTTQTELTRSPRVVPFRELPEMVAVDPGVAEDPGERPALEFTMKRDHERSRALVVFEAHMATALANCDPSNLSESVDQLLAGENR